MVVDFQRLNKLDEIWRTEKKDSFDVSPNELWHEDIRPAVYDMSAAVIDDMKAMQSWQRGVGLVTGGVGSGKSALLTQTAYKGKFYWGRTPILDYRPTELFGYYEYFNQQTLAAMLQQMNEVVDGEVESELKKSKNGEKYSRFLEQVTHAWFEEQGKIYFQHAVFGIDEAKRYLNKRRPHNPVGLVISDINVEWRHLDSLILMATTDPDYLDKWVFKELSLRIVCFTFGGGVSFAKIHEVKSVTNDGVIQLGKKPQYYQYDLFKPREILHGKALKDLWNTTNKFSMKVPKSLTRG